MRPTASRLQVLSVTTSEPPVCKSSKLVVRLVEKAARVEIEATAVVPR